MKKIVMITLGLCCLGLLAPNLASAKGKKGKKEKPTAEQTSSAKAILAKYDADNNGMLDQTESDKLKADYAAGNETDAKVFDVNNDGKLDDTEIAAIEKDGAAKKKKKNKSE